MSKTSNLRPEAWDVNKRLAELALKREILLDAVRRGSDALANCTPNHPISYGGSAFWAETICGAAELLAPSGWRRIDPSGQPLLINAKGNLAFTVSTGDENTGKLDSLVDPYTKYPKGPITINEVKANSGWLFPELEEDERARLECLKYDFWILLAHRDDVSGVVRCEFSRPVDMDKQGHIRDWSERIILGEIPFHKGGYERKPEDGGGDAPQKSGEIIVQIKRRA